MTVADNDRNYVAGTSRRDGSVPNFVDRILQKYMVEREEVPISEESRAFSPTSSFTACVHDIALNNTDLCIGSFWTLETRQRLASFTASFDSMQLYVIAPRLSQMASLNLGELLYRPVLPFTPMMWLGLLFALSYAGYALYTLDATEHDDEEQDDEELEDPDEGRIGMTK